MTAKKGSWSVWLKHSQDGSFGLPAVCPWADASLPGSYVNHPYTSSGFSATAAFLCLFSVSQETMGSLSLNNSSIEPNAFPMSLVLKEKVLIRRVFFFFFDLE